MFMVKKMKYLKEAMPYIIILMVVILIRTFIVTPIKVNGESMYDTLNGSEIMILWRTKDIQRYDIVVADLIENGRKTDTLIKRVYGLPGETISCEDGIIYINDKKIEDSYAYGKIYNDYYSAPWRKTICECNRSPCRRNGYFA